MAIDMYLYFYLGIGSKQNRDSQIALITYKEMVELHLG
jgi:hypothetical protein